MLIAVPGAMGGEVLLQPAIKASAGAARDTRNLAGPIPRAPGKSAGFAGVAAARLLAGEAAQALRAGGSQHPILALG
jgi:hypothetical protein